MVDPHRTGAAIAGLRRARDVAEAGPLVRPSQIGAVVRGLPAYSVIAVASTSISSPSIASAVTPTSVPAGGASAGR